MHLGELDAAFDNLAEAANIDISDEEVRVALESLASSLDNWPRLITLYEAELDHLSDDTVRHALHVVLARACDREVHEKLAAVRFYRLVHGVEPENRDVLDALERLLDLLPFRLIPVCLDVCLAVTVLTRVGQPLVAAIAFATLCAYAGVTLALTQWRTRYWRAMVEAEREAKGLAVEALMNVETVKLFAAEEYEVAKYAAQFGAILAQCCAILAQSCAILRIL